MDDFRPAQSRTDLRVLRVRRGATVRFHFRFTPREVAALTLFGRNREHATLPPARVVEWQPTRSGAVVLSTLAAQGDAVFVLRVRLV